MTEWDDIAATYEDQFEKRTGFTIDRLVNWVDPHPGLRIADVAAGPGTVTIAMAHRGATVFASDFSPAMVERLAQRAVDAGLGDLVEARVADGESLPYDEKSFDAAVSNFGVIFCPDVAAALRELARVTRRSGCLAITAWTVEARNGWTTLLAHDYADELGFTLDPRPMYRWARADDLRGACEAAGWARVEVDTIHFPPTVHASAERVVDALETPATTLALASLAPAQVDRLRSYIVERARSAFGDGEVPLPHEAWLARGVA